MSTTTTTDWLYKYTKAWSTDLLPTPMTLTHVSPQAYSGLVSTLLSIVKALPTETNRLSLYNMAKAGKGAQASLSVISAQNYLATATDTQSLPSVTQVIWNSTMQLQQLEEGINLYQMELSPIANGLFAGLFGLLLVAHIILCIWRKQHYVGICLSMGTACELAGYVGRCASIGNYSDQNAYLVQIICLTLAPALLMAGVYFVLALLTVIYGRKYSMLKPLFFSYVFVFCDFVSLVIQAAGGGSAAVQLQQFGNTKPGTYTMIAGIAFQVLSMTIFLFFLFDFMRRIWFNASAEVKFSFRNLFDLLFVTKRGKRLSQMYLTPNYNQKYSHVWSRKGFSYFPLVLIVAVGLIYVRCVYRLIELREGWSGYLIKHEAYVMTLDGLMVLLMVIMLVPFHPGFLMGPSLGISVKDTEEDVRDFYEAQDGKLFGGSSWSDNSTKNSRKSEKVRSREVSVSTQASSPVQEKRGLNIFSMFTKKTKGNPNETHADFEAVPYLNTKEEELRVPSPQQEEKLYTPRPNSLKVPQIYVNPYETPRSRQSSSGEVYSGRINPYRSAARSPLQTYSSNHTAFDRESYLETNDEVQSRDSHDEDYFTF